MLKKADLNKNIHFNPGNKKLQGNDKCIFLTFNLPAVVTCPYATDLCKYICYAKLEEGFRPSVLKNRNESYEESKKVNFVSDAINHLNWQLSRPSIAHKHIYVRIHASGDFYNQGYFNKWVLISERFRNNPRISFQAYTKNLSVLEPYADSINGIEHLNITLVYSIMPDTKPEQIELAKKLKLKLFYAKPIGTIKESEIKCGGRCGECTHCYHKDNNIKEINIEYHGARAKRASERATV